MACIALRLAVPVRRTMLLDRRSPIAEAEKSILQTPQPSAVGRRVGHARKGKMPFHSSLVHLPLWRAKGIIVEKGWQRVPNVPVNSNEQMREASDVGAYESSAGVLDTALN
jgi:hypothetical protein